MSNSAIKLTILCALFVLVAGQVLAFPGSGAQPAGSSAAAPQAVALKGTVVETMNAGGYTYVCLENDGKKAWAATPATQVKVGDSVEVAPGMVMRNFSSKSLGRTFDAIVFSNGLTKK